jgi:2'-5' RNA ligase
MGTGATVTLGVSLAVPEPYGTQLQGRRASFGDVAAHGIPTHITLLPPTEVAADARPAIEAHLARVALSGRSFPVRLSGTGTFRPLSPVVFVQVTEGGSACSWLQERVRGPEGPLVRELHFPYHPHVTVAHGISESAMDRAHAELADFECAWTASGFALYAQGEDAVWRLQREFSFADADGATGTGTGAAPGSAAPGAPAPGSGAGAVPVPLAVPAGCRPPAQRRPVSRPPATL